MKRILFIFVILSFSLCLLFSCGNSSLTELQKSVKNLSTRINDETVKVFKVAEKLDKEIEDLFNNKDLNSVSDSSRFVTFQEKMYVTKFDAAKDESASVFFGAIPITDKIKKQMSLLDQKIGPLIKQLVNEDKYILRITIQAPTNALISYPGLDIASIFPVGFDYSEAPWYKELQKGKEKPLWILPTISLGPEGWIHDPGASLDIGPDNQFFGTFGLDMPVLNLINDVMKDVDQEKAILITFADTTVIGSTKGATNILKGIDIIGEYDYITQLKENPKATNELRLNYEQHNDVIKSLAGLIKNENVNKNNLSITIDGKDHIVVLEQVDQTGYFVIGLL